MQKSTQLEKVNGIYEKAAFQFGGVSSGKQLIILLITCVYLNIVVCSYFCVAAATYLGHQKVTNTMAILQVIRGGKVSRMETLVLICWKTFAVP